MDLTIPASILPLLFAYFNQAITEEQHDRLDAWICASEENQCAFETCLELTLINEEKSTAR